MTPLILTLYCLIEWFIEISLTIVLFFLLKQGCSMLTLIFLILLQVLLFQNKNTFSDRDFTRQDKLAHALDFFQSHI